MADWAMVVAITQVVLQIASIWLAASQELRSARMEAANVTQASTRLPRDSFLKRHSLAVAGGVAASLSLTILVALPGPASRLEIVLMALSGGWWWAMVILVLLMEVFWRFADRLIAFAAHRE